MQNRTVPLFINYEILTSWVKNKKKTKEIILTKVVNGHTNTQLRRLSNKHKTA